MGATTLDRRATTPVVGRALPRAVPAALVAVLVLVPDLLGSTRLVHLATTAVIYAIVTAGLGILYGEAGQMSVAHGALWGIGAYAAAIASTEWGWAFLATLPLAMGAAAVAALVVGYPSLRVRGHYFLIVTFAFAELARVVLANTKSVTGGNQGLLVLAPADVPGVDPSGDIDHFYYLALAALLLVLAGAWLLRRSSLGRAFRMVRDNEVLAQSLGLDVTRCKLAAFAISGAVAGLAGALYAFLLRHIEPDLFGSVAGIQIVLMLLLGGARSLAGPVIGAAIYFLAPEVIDLSPTDTQLGYGLLLIVIVLLAPAGIAETVPALLRRWAAAGRARWQVRRG